MSEPIGLRISLFALEMFRAHLSLSILQVRHGICLKRIDGAALGSLHLISKSGFAEKCHFDVL